MKNNSRRAHFERHSVGRGIATSVFDQDHPKVGQEDPELGVAQDIARVEASGHGTATTRGELPGTRSLLRAAGALECSSS